MTTLRGAKGAGHSYHGVVRGVVADRHDCCEWHAVAPPVRMALTKATPLASPRP
jgi:hypothetical protein